MKGFVDNIEQLTEDNNDFRRVLYTGHNLQLVLMAIQPGDEIGEEVHDDRDQFFRIEGGTGEIWIDGVCNTVKADDGIIVPQGARHNVISTGSEALSLCVSTPFMVRPNISMVRFTRHAQRQRLPMNTLTGRPLSNPKHQPSIWPAQNQAEFK